MKRKKITCETARNISIVKALERLGHFPKKASGKEAWFLSPLRSETQASFKVSKKHNRWYDHGKGIGGNVIDLITRILKCSVKEALGFLGNDIPVFSFQQQKIFTNLSKVDQKTEIKISIVKTKRIEHPALIQYLLRRKISVPIAEQFCKEVWYHYNDKHYFAIGLQNTLGGWELRNKFLKNCSSPKSYTYFKKNKSELIILEGMFDLLSFVELEFEDANNKDFIILNSIAFIKDIEKYIKSYKKVSLYLDNDTPGRKATAYLIANNNQVIDCSQMYKNYKDLNEFLKDEKGTKI